MTIYRLGALMTVVHLLAGGVGSIIIANLVSFTGVATYGGESGFLPGNDAAYSEDDSPYTAFGKFLYGDGQPEPHLPGDTSGGLGLAKYAVTEGVCMVSTGVKWILIMASFSYPVIDIIPMEGFGLWVRIVIHLVAFGCLAALLWRLFEMLIAMGVFSNVYAMIALGALGSAGLVSTIVAEVADIAC